LPQPSAVKAGSESVSRTDECVEKVGPDELAAGSAAEEPPAEENGGMF